MMKSVSIMFLLILSAAVSTWAQTDQSTPKLVRAGVLNGRATTLVRPPYPAAARAVRAGGMVSVQVTISEEGKVTEAEAVSGHPLLREVCEKAALSSIFPPTQIKGNPVKVVGIIVYNFTVPMSMTEMGFDLAVAERSAKDRDTVEYSMISSNLPRELADEQKDLIRLAAVFYPKSTEPKIDSNTPADSASVGRYDPTKPRSGKVEPPIDDPSKFIRELRLRILEKLGPESPRGWLFSLGAKLQLLESELYDASRTRSNLDDLKAHTETVPAAIRSDVISKIRDLIAIGGERDEKSLDEIRERIRNLRR